MGTSKLVSARAIFATALQTPDGSFVAYMPTARTITVNLASLKAPANAKWFDPTNGVYTSIAGAAFANTGNTAPPAREQPRGRRATGSFTRCFGFPLHRICIEEPLSPPRRAHEHLRFPS